jgi:hypothetical protein
MHPAGELSLEERLHVPLTLAIAQVGIRLGALVALVARRADQIEQWSWLLRPREESECSPDEVGAPGRGGRR